MSNDHDRLERNIMGMLTTLADQDKLIMQIGKEQKQQLAQIERIAARLVLLEKGWE